MQEKSLVRDIKGKNVLKLTQKCGNMFMMVYK